MNSKKFIALVQNNVLLNKEARTFFVLQRIHFQVWSYCLFKYALSSNY